MARRRRLFISAIVMVMVAALVSVTGSASAQSGQAQSQVPGAAQQLMNQLAEAGDREISLDQLKVDGLGPPPWTSFVPNRDPAEIQAWTMLAQRFPELRGQANLSPTIDAQELVISESEPAGQAGGNDTPETGEPVAGFGTGEGNTNFARLFGTLFAPVPPPDCTSAEDDGAIDIASPTNLNSENSFQLCAGFLGDGPNGESSGDFDFYAMNEIEEGRVLIVEVVPSRETGEEPPTSIAIYNSAGDLIAELDDTDPNQAIYIETVAPATDSYFALVGGLDSSPANPFDSASGNGATSTGAYEVYVVNFPPPGGPDGPVANCSSAEEDGSIGTAVVTDLNAENQVVLCVGEIGDSDHEGLGGDFDFFATNTIEQGRTVIAEVVPGRTGAPEPATTVAIYNSAGVRLVSGDDRGGEDGPVAIVQTVAPETDNYFIAVSGLGNVPADPNDPSSGSGSDSVGEYQMFIGNLVEPVPDEFRFGHWRTAMDEPAEPAPDEPPAQDEVSDRDVYLVDLEAGDVITAAFEPSGIVEIFNPDGTLAIGSFQSASFIYPTSSPLRHLGTLGADHVARTSGTYAVSISQSAGPYEGELRVARSGREGGSADDVQIIYLDFDGASLSPSLFDPFAPTEELPLSPMIDFFPRWGLSSSEEDRVIDAVMTEVQKELGDHLRDQEIYGNRDLTGVPGEFDIEIRNSRDHRDIWGQKNVSRVIIGGTIDEFGIPTIGIAQSIDPGNLDSEESAVVLLDILSASPEEVGDSTLNAYKFASTSSKAELVGAGIGVIVAHEVGHFIGNWHTETGNDVFNIMDAGGDLAGTFGVGPDRVFGTDDDIDVHFVSDVFNSGEGFLGVEDTESRTGFAMLTGPLADNQPPQGLTVEALLRHSKFSEADAEVLRLYVAFFNRQPDPGGANYWVAVRYNGGSLGEIAGFFTDSQEFQNNYDDTTNAEYVARVYENVLGRDYDQAGYEYWLNLLDTGELDRAGVVVWISLNKEFVAANPFAGK